MPRTNNSNLLRWQKKCGKKKNNGDWVEKKSSWWTLWRKFEGYSSWQKFEFDYRICSLLTELVGEIPWGPVHPGKHRKENWELRCQSVNSLFKFISPTDEHSTLVFIFKVSDMNLTTLSSGSPGTETRNSTAMFKLASRSPISGNFCLRSLTISVWSFKGTWK